MIPAAIVTVLVVIVLAVIAALHKDSKFTGVEAVVAGIHFLALLSVTLSIVQIGFIGIEKLIPDLLTDSSWRVDSNQDTARYALAVLIIAAPLFLVILKFGKKQAVKTVSWIKRFMAVTVLLVAGLVVVGTLVTLIYSFLSGELGMRMLTKAVLLLVVSGGVSSYYQLFVRQGKEVGLMTATSIFGWLTAAVILVTLVGGFMVTGGPAAARAERFDDERLSDLASLQWQINSYWLEENKLPEDLSVLNDALRGYSVPADPRTKEAYGYRALGEVKRVDTDGAEVKTAKFEICATFETERSVDDESTVYGTKPVMSSDVALPDYYSGSDSPYWNHPIGYHCFEREMKDTKDPVMQTR